MDQTRKTFAGTIGKRAILWLGMLMGLATCLDAMAQSYSFAVVPQFEQRKLFAIWKPIVDDLEKRTGLDLKLVATLTVPEFEKGIAKGEFDFVYANPYHILKATSSQGYIPLVRDSAPLRGILVVRKDSPIRNVQDIDGKTVAFPSPNALGASLLMRADLERIFHITVAPLYVKTYSSVYLHVVNGLTAAGGGVEKTLQEQDPEIRDMLKVLYTTRDMPSHPVAAHPRVTQTDSEKVQRALLEMGETKQGREWLDKVPMKRLVATTIEDYTVMRNWGLESLWVEE